MNCPEHRQVVRKNVFSLRHIFRIYIQDVFLGYIYIYIYINRLYTFLSNVLKKENIITRNINLHLGANQINWTLL